MITNLTGPALVVVKGEKTPAAPMMNLFPKTLIELRGGTKMTVVFFGQGTQEQYVGPALVGIGVHRGKVFHGEESARTVVSTNSALVKAVDPNALSEAPGKGISGHSRSGWEDDTLLDHHDARTLPRFNHQTGPGWEGANQRMGRRSRRQKFGLHGSHARPEPDLHRGS